MKANWQPHSQPQPHPIYTNDLIEIMFPFQQFPNAQITIQWSRYQVSPFNPLWDHFGSNSASIDNKYENPSKILNVYKCSPFDYSCIITGLIAVKSPEANEPIIEKLEYGPIQLQQQLLNEPQGWKRNNVEIMIGKQNKIGVLDIIKEKRQLMIKIRVNEAELCISMDKDTKDQVIKFYNDDKKCSAFGILIEDQDDFKKFMRKLNVSAHLGKYLKVSFISRQARDLLILDIIKAIGVQLPKKVIDKLAETGPSKNKLKIETIIRRNQPEKQQIQIKAEKIEKVKKVKKTEKEEDTLKNMEEEAKTALLNTFGSQSKIPIMSKNNFEFENESFEQEPKEPVRSRPPNPTQSANIIQQIYNILNTPLSSVQKEVEFAQLEFDAHQHKFYSDKLGQMMHSQTIETKRFDQKVENKNDDKMNFRKKRKSEIRNQKNDDTCQIQYIYKEKESLIANLMETNESQKYQMLDYQDENRELKAKIQGLQQKNQTLTYENSRLKEQNLKLRYEKLQNNQVDISKMLEIRQMVQKMATRLEVLQTINQPSGLSAKNNEIRYKMPSKLMDKLEISKLRKQGEIVKSQKMTNTTNLQKFFPKANIPPHIKYPENIQNNFTKVINLQKANDKQKNTPIKSSKGVNLSEDMTFPKKNNTLQDQKNGHVDIHPNSRILHPQVHDRFQNRNLGFLSPQSHSPYMSPDNSRLLNQQKSTGALNKVQNTKNSNFMGIINEMQQRK